MSEDKNEKDDVTSGSQNGDVEQREEKLKYPRAIPFIISNEFCERFNYYGMRTILVLYMTRKLAFSDDLATILYHSFTTLVYFFCIFGAIIADSWWGKFNTILWLSMVYVSGSVIITIGAIEPWNLPMTTFTIIGLSLIALGSGGIKPCVAAFGGEQFKLPQQAKQLGLFFSLFYFSINLGSFISTFVTPILREDVKCLGMGDCFPLGFGLPAALMAVSIIIFLSGKFLYKILPNQGNMLVKVCKCIGNAVSTRSREKTTNPKGHWLEYAEKDYGRKLVMETKILLNVLVLYLPLPIFWALFDQQGSRWTFQATRMNGDLGFYTIKPDQMQVINPLLILVFIPLYEVVFYPLLNLIGVRRPLQKITLGGIFAGVAFLCSMGVEIMLEPTYPVLPQVGEAQFRIFNGLNCDFAMDAPTLKGTIINIPMHSHYIDLNVEVAGDSSSLAYDLTSTTPNCGSASGTFNLKSNTATSFFINGLSTVPVVRPYEDDPQKSRQGTPLVRVLANFLSTATVFFKDKDGIQYNETMSNSELTDVQANVYEVIVDDKVVLKDQDLRHGGVYTFIIQETTAGNYRGDVVTITDPNSVNMLWLVPQFVIMTLGEVMYSVTGLQFSYTQAPTSMRSVLQGCWLLTIAVGNLIVTIIVGAKFFNSQTYEFALFAGLMFVDMGIFMWLAYRFKGIPLEELDKIDEEERALEEKKDKDALDFPGSSRDD